MVFLSNQAETFFWISSLEGRDKKWTLNYQTGKWVLNNQDTTWTLSPKTSKWHIN